MKDHLADAELDRRHATDPNECARVDSDITELAEDIERLERVLENPQGAAQRVEHRIVRGLAREREPEKSVTTVRRVRIINPPTTQAPYRFEDRYLEFKRIDKFLRDDAERIMTFVGQPGIGKTAMLHRLLKSLENGQLPDDLGSVSVDGVVYLSTTGTRIIDFPCLFPSLCNLLPDETSHRLEDLWSPPQITTISKMYSLLGAFPTGRVVVLLDNFEGALDRETMELRDAALGDALGALVNAPQHAVKVIIATHITPPGLDLVQPIRQARLDLDNGLEPPFAEFALREMDADGKVGLKHASDDLIKRAVEYTRGSPRALELLFAILAADRYTTLEEILGARTEAVAPPPTAATENIVEELVSEAREDFASAVGFHSIGSSNSEFGIAGATGTETRECARGGPGRWRWHSSPLQERQIDRWAGRVT